MTTEMVGPNRNKNCRNRRNGQIWLFYDIQRSLTRNCWKMTSPCKI